MQLSTSMLFSSSPLVKVIPGLMIWTLIAFAITFFVLKRYAFGPIQKLIDERRERIRQSVARQPELRGELQGLMWLGFALTEAVVFYGFLGGLLGYVLV